MKKRFNSFKYAFKGILILMRNQPNFRIQVVLYIVVVIAGLAFNLSKFDWLYLIVAMGLVITLEAINSAIEYTIDFISPEHHPMAGKIKDVSAAAVLLASLTTLIIGIIIFAPYVIEFLF